MRCDPMMVPERSPTGDSPERVDPRVLRGPAKRGGQRFLHRCRRFFALGPAIHCPILNAARIHDHIEVQDLRQERALLAYRQTVLLGPEAVENALPRIREARRRFDTLRDAGGVERRAVALAHDRYRSGLVDFLDGLKTERTLYAAQTELARSERAVAQDLVRLCKALGGGWSHDTARAQVNAISVAHFVQE